jgi:hypothetical protein
MKNVQKFVLSVVLIGITLFASGQSNTDVKQVLSNPETRKLIMDTIANDSIMSKEMMTTMMNSKNHKMMMMENHGSMMKDNHGMKHCMMSAMMDACKGDTSMMSKCKAMMEACKGDTCMMSKCKAMMPCKGDTSMMPSKCRTMMENPQMKEMTEKRMNENKDVKNIEAVDKTKLIEIKKEK